MKPEEIFPMLAYLEQADESEIDTDPVESAQAMLHAVGAAPPELRR